MLKFVAVYSYFLESEIASPYRAREKRVSDREEAKARDWSSHKAVERTDYLVIRL